MKHVSIFFVLLLCFTTPDAIAQVAGPAVFDTVMARIRTDQRTGNTPADTQVEKYLALQNSDGSFNDIDYTRTERTNWPPQAHLDRILKMANCYLAQSSRLYQSQTLHGAIVHGLQLWYAKNPKSSNWWYNQIAVPKALGLILIDMRGDCLPLPAALETDILSRMKSNGGDPRNQAGANKVDVATHWLYRSCLEKNTEDLAFATGQVFQPLTFTTDEGIQHDWSYFQHGRQLYIGGYGRVLIEGVAGVAKYLVNTAYALSGEKLALLGDFVCNTYLKSIRGQYHLFNILGRGMTREGALYQAGFAKTLESLKRIDPVHRTEYDQAIDRLKGNASANFAVKPMHTHYWRGDYTLHQRPDYTFDVRMASTRTARNENGNEENLKGYFLSDGGTDIAIDGDEYASVIPVWDWTKIPGTTTPEMPEIPLAKSYIWPGKSAFAGGVSDGMCGATGFDLCDSEFGVDTYGKKSWFFFDREVVCLGAGIRSGSGFNVTTTLNQCRLKGDVALSVNGHIAVLPHGKRDYNNPNWMLHNKVAYYFPVSGSKITVSNQTQSGSWYAVNKTQSRDTVSEEVFSAWFNHGLHPVAEKYAYIVVPNTNSVDAAKNYPVKNIRILANTDSVQAVHHHKQGITGILFYRAATLSSDGISVQADKGCAVLFKKIGRHKAKVYVADPAQTGNAITLHVVLPGMKGVRVLVCKPLPFPYAGKTQEYELSD